MREHTEDYKMFCNFFNHILLINKNYQNVKNLSFSNIQKTSYVLIPVSLETFTKKYFFIIQDPSEIFMMKVSL
jgi:hypothetical protein